MNTRGGPKGKQLTAIGLKRKRITTKEQKICKETTTEKHRMLLEFSATVVTVKDLHECFNTRLMFQTRHYDEVILVFDTYKADFLKRASRRNKDKGRIRFGIRSEMIPASNTFQ